MAVLLQMLGDSLQCLPQSATVLCNKVPYLVHERSAEGMQYFLLCRLRNILRTTYFPLMLIVVCLMHVFYAYIPIIHVVPDLFICTSCLYIMHSFAYRAAEWRTR